MAGDSNKFSSRSPQLYRIVYNIVRLPFNSTVDREIFAFKYFRVINVRVSNFHHKVQEVKIIHGVFYFRVLNFCRGEKILTANISPSTVYCKTRLHEHFIWNTTL